MKIPKKLPWKLIFCWPLFLIGLLGCAYSVDELRGPEVDARGFLDGGSQPLEAEWWRVFEDLHLNGIMDQAIAGNFDLESAYYRLEAAQAIYDRERSSLFPSLNGEASWQRRRPEATNGDQVELGLAAGYEIDLWGRLSASRAAEGFRFEASQWDYQTALLTLSAEITQTWFRLITESKQLTLIQSQFETNESLLRLLRNRFESGQIQRTDLLRQQQLLESTREQLYLAEQRLETRRYELNLLMGKAPRAMEIKLPSDMPVLPDLPDTGVASELIHRRPDLRASYQRLLATNKELAVASANQFPRISLSASIRTSENDAVSLFDDWVRNLGANLVAPIFEGGARRADVRRARAETQAALANYGQSVLEAILEVEQALLDERQQKRRLESLERQLELAEAAFAQLQREYSNGVSDYLDVLSSLTSLQGLRRELLSAHLEIYETRLSLYRALAGEVVSNDQILSTRETTL